MWVLLSSTATAVLAAALTAWLNRRYFREELGESDLAQRYLEVFTRLGGESAQIMNDAIQASAAVAVLKQQMLTDGRPDLEIRKAAALELKQPAITLRTRAADLKRYYVLLPAAIIEALQNFEATIWKTYTNPSFEGLRLKDVIDAHDTLIGVIRDCTRRLISRRSPASEMLDDLTKESYLPPYIRDVFYPSS